MQPPEVREAIKAIGPEMDPTVMARVHELFRDEQLRLAAEQPASATDIPYGDHERHRLDLYSPAPDHSLAPVLVFVHGGGFLRGDKGSAEQWPNTNVGRMAAQAGLLGVVMNYRLAPDHGWPAGGEDVAAVVDWLKLHAAEYGGDPERIVLAGTSAGAAHVATYLMLRPEAAEVQGAVLLSGLYGIMPMTGTRELAYFGEDRSRHAERIPLEAMTATQVPLLVACAEFDPPGFQAEFVGLLSRRLERHGRLPRSYVASGHNHYSIAYHLGTADRRLADEIVAFARNVT